MTGKRPERPGDSSSSPSKKMKSIMSQEQQHTSSSSGSPALFEASLHDDGNSIDILGEIKHENPKPIQSETGNPQPSFDSSAIEENSLDFLGEIKHENPQPIQSETGNVQPSFDSSGKEESKNLQHSSDSSGKEQKHWEAIAEAEGLKNEIKLIPTPMDWTIIKNLTKTDLIGLTLLVKSVKDHILNFFTKIPDNRSEIHIDVYDHDCDLTYQMQLGYGRDGYNRIGGLWKENVVERRRLRVGDQIKLKWDPLAYRLVFCVISGAGSSRGT